MATVTGECGSSTNFIAPRPPSFPPPAYLLKSYASSQSAVPCPPSYPPPAFLLPASSAVSNDSANKAVVRDDHDIGSGCRVDLFNPFWQADRAMLKQEPCPPSSFPPVVLVQCSSISSDVSGLDSCDKLLSCRTVTGIDDMCYDVGESGSAIVVGNRYWHADPVMFEKARKDLSRLCGEVRSWQDGFDSEYVAQDVDRRQERIMTTFLLALLRNLSYYCVLQKPSSVEVSTFTMNYVIKFQSRLVVHGNLNDLCFLMEQFLRQHKSRWPVVDMSERELRTAVRDTVIGFGAQADSDGW